MFHLDVPRYLLGSLAQDHPNVPAELFVLAFAARIGAGAGSETAISVGTRTSSIRGARQRVAWTFVFPNSLNGVDQFRSGLNDTIVTEFAAIAVAASQAVCALGLRFKEVTLRGERGDYWLEDGSGNASGMCEVSGTNRRGTTVGAMFEEKSKQIKQNKKARPCFVAVTSFPRLQGAFCRVR